METVYHNIAFGRSSFFCRLRLSVVLLLVFVLSASALTIGGVVEYCDWESFNATCASDSVILIRSARYGRMRNGRCLTSISPGDVCSRDVTSEFDQRCSGRNNCSVRVISMHSWKCGLKDYMNFLEASYECRGVANGRLQTCANESSIVLPVAESDILANIFSSSGSVNCPFIIRVQPHQRINLTLADFSVARADQSSSGLVQPETCRQVAIVTELHENGNSTVTEICGGRERETGVYVSATNTIALQFNHSYTQHAIINYQAVGCAPLVAPPNAWVSRSTGQTISIRCNRTDEAWHLTCLGVHWVGEIGNCSASMTHPSSPSDEWSLNDVFANSSHYPLGVLIVVCVGVAIGVAVGVLLLVIVIAYMRRRRKIPIRQSTSTIDKKTQIQSSSFSTFSRQQVTPLSVATATIDKGSWTRNRPLPDPRSQMETLYFRHVAPATACSTATPLNDPCEFTLLSSSSGVFGTPSSTVFSNCSLARTAGRAGCCGTVARQPPSLNARLESEEACALMSWQSESCLPGNSAPEETRMDTASPYYFKLDPAAMARRNEEHRGPPDAGPSQAGHPQSAPILDAGGCALCHASATLNRRPHIFHCPTSPPTWTKR